MLKRRGVFHMECLLNRVLDLHAVVPGSNCALKILG